MTEADYLYCLLHQWLDWEEALEGLCPACRNKAMEPCCKGCGQRLSDLAAAHNEGFDTARFAQLKGAKRT